MNKTTQENRLYADLQALKDGYPTLCLIADRKASVVARQQGPRSRSIAPIPLNIGAWQLKQDIDQLVTALVRACGIHAGRMDTTGRLKGVILNEKRLLEREDLPAIAALVRQAAHRLDRTLNPPPDTKMVGWCPECNTELRCDQQELESGWTACPRCKGEWRIREIHEMDMIRMAFNRTRGTASGISRMLAPWGIDIKANTITQWAKRGLLTPIGLQDDAPVYLVWDVWKTHTRKKR